MNKLSQSQQHRREQGPARGKGQGARLRGILRCPCSVVKWKLKRETAITISPHGSQCTLNARIARNCEETSTSSTPFRTSFTLAGSQPVALWEALIKNPS